LLFQDPVVCRFNESNNQCSVALGQQLHLQMSLEDSFNLKITDKPNISRIILKYRKTQNNTQTPNIPGWQFVNDNKTLILTSAERNNSGTYTLESFDVNGNNKGSSSLQLKIKAQVSSVKVSYSCLSPGVMKVSCSADGDNLRFNWTPDLNKTLDLENRISTLILYKDHHGNVTCSVENHVSRDHITTEVPPCPESTTVSSCATTPAEFTTVSISADLSGFMVFVSVWLFEVLILLLLLVGGLYIFPRLYRKQRITE
ncbi:uncharacterized protein DAT39_016957, partial [Clarias magur]